MAHSPTLFSSDDEEPLVIMKEKDLRKKLQQLLQGVPPPSSITISTLSAEEILSKYKENEPSFGLGNFEKSDNNSHRSTTDLTSFKNNSDVSEDIAALLQKVQERYVQLETMTSCNVWFQQSIPLTGSAKKRCRARQRVGLSPGRRLSHLARRKQIFSCANLQRMADLEKRKHLEIKKSGIYQDKVKGAAQYEKLNTSKRALFLSPDEEFPNNSKLVKEFPKRKLFSSSEKKKKLPLQENSKRSDVKRWLFHQNFTSEVSRKRLRDEISDQLPERKKKCPRRSLTFADEDESSKSPASSSTRSSHSLPPLSQNHKNKMLWAVSVALKEANIQRKDGNFKTCASSLFMTLRKNLNQILSSYNETSSTSEKMLLFAREGIPRLLEKLGLPPLEKNTNSRAVLTPVKNQKNEQQVKANEGGKENLNEGEVAKTEFDVVFKTPKKFIRVKKKSKTCGKVRGRSCFKGVLVRCKSLESLNASGDDSKGSVAKNLFREMDNSSNFGGDDAGNNCDDSCSFNQDNTISEMTFLNDSDMNLASHSLAPSSVGDEADGNLLLAALKRKDVNIVEESDSSNDSQEIGNQDFKEEEKFEERIEESEDEGREELKGPVMVEESADEDEKEAGSEGQSDVMMGPAVVEESADEEEQEVVKSEERQDVLSETDIVRDEEQGAVKSEERQRMLSEADVVGDSGDEEEQGAVKSEQRQDVLSEADVVGDSGDEEEPGTVKSEADIVGDSGDEEQGAVKSEQRQDVLSEADVVGDSGDEEDKEVSEVDIFSSEPTGAAIEEKETLVKVEQMEMDVSIKEEYENNVENMETEEGTVEVKEENVELEKGEVRDAEIVIKEEPDDEDEKFPNDAENSMLPPQTSTPILSPVLKKSQKNRKLMVKKTKRNWKIVRDQSQEVPLEDLKLKVRLSHEWEVVAVNSSASELESSCNMNQSSMISLCNESYQPEETESKLSSEEESKEEDLSAIRLKELLEEKNFVEIEPKPFVNEIGEEQEEAQIENVINVSPASTVDHQTLHEILRSENKYLKPDEHTPDERSNSPVLTNSDQKKRVLSLENYKARKQQEVSNDLDGISPLKPDDGSNPDQVPFKKIYNIRLKQPGSHKRKHKHRREERITPETQERHHRRVSSDRDRSMNSSSESVNRQKSKRSGSEHKSIESPDDQDSTEQPKVTPEKVIEDNIRGAITMQAMFKALFDISNVLDQQIKYVEGNPGSVQEEAITKTLQAASLINDAISKSLDEMKKERNSAEAAESWLDLLSNFYASNPLMKAQAKISPNDPRVKNNEPGCSKDVTPKHNDSLYRPYCVGNEETPPKPVGLVVQPPPVVQNKNVQIPKEQTPPRPSGFVAKIVQNNLGVVERPAGFVPSPLVQNNVPNECTPPKPRAFVAQPPIIHHNVPNEHTPPRQILHVPQNASNNLYKQAVERNNQNWHERNTWHQPNSPVLNNRSYYQSEIPRKPLLEGSPGFSNYNYSQSRPSSSTNQVSTNRTDGPGYWIHQEAQNCSRLEDTRGFSNYNYPQNVAQHSQRPNYPHYSGTRGIPSHHVEEFCSPERNPSRYYNQSYHTPDSYMYNNHSISPSPNGMYNSYSSWQSPNNRWNGYQQSPVAKPFRSMVTHEAPYYSNC